MTTKQSTLIIRIPNELKHKVELLAEEQGVSLNQFSLYAFTKEVVQMETQSYFLDYQKDKKRKEILSNYDEVMKKISKRKVPDWDKV